MKETDQIQISGMHCAACATRIERIVSKMDGVQGVQVNLTTEKGRITFDKQVVSIQDVIQKIMSIGFKASIAGEQQANTKHHELTVLKWQFIVSALLTIPLAWAMLSHFQWASFVTIPALLLNPLFQFAITIPIQLIIGFQFYERAWLALKSGSANMDTLVVLSTSAAFFYSHYLTFTTLHTPIDPQTIVLFYETSAFIITFILLGKLLEARAKMKTTEAIKKLYQLQTKTATLYAMDGTESPLAVDQLAPGHVIIVKSGEKVPIDGQVLKGNSMVDESLLTGESIPIEKGNGSSVYAGTVNQNGTLIIEVTKRDSETTLSQIIRIVEEAQTSKAPIQQIADKITGVFVPIIIGIALLTFALSYLLLEPATLSSALEKMIAVLIIACPCALGLATPTSVMVGSGRAAQVGILFKEGKFLEVLGKATTIVLDKTGTITKGEPQVTDTYVHDGNERAFFEIVGAVESASGHPIANAIMRAARQRVVKFPQANQAEAIPGYGMQATVNGQQTLISNPTYFMEQKIHIPRDAKRMITKLERAGKTVVVAAIQSRFAGIIAIADELKPSSCSAISRLRKMGIDVMMLTGDNQAAAQSIARKTGINKVQANVPPQRKAEIIQTLQKKRGKVVMVGDGINDAPALTVADVGIAIGTGSDIAIESGDITVIKGDLSKVVEAVKLSKATMTNIKQNFAWAFLYNLICIPFAMFGLLAPWLAGAVMAFSSVSVVLNALRLQKSRI
ncbi:copper-translocating P-type ATPase [Ammoniphilus oxalaticus]|uniref:Copper-exporting P-type ATPase n=2 Tax=Ammoniphilus oxalaticus TaxID=66863 RepID=A0A419SP57_9BACL|nr:copper-translocating P-type ATPase [Ammoniphilus oxalaticus]